MHLKSWTTIAQLRSNTGQNVSCREGQVCRFLALPACRAVLKTRTNFRRNFVRGLSTRIWELSAMTV
jgi:hypothetical protein